MKKIDRIGEERLNNFGSKMIIKEYRKAIDIDVYFPEYNWTFEHARYDNFKNGKIKCPYEPSTYIIKDILCELFIENISDRAIEKFLAVRKNVKMDEFISMYKECIGENCLSFMLSF